jgi:hypothetical protein
MGKDLDKDLGVLGAVLTDFAGQQVVVISGARLVTIMSALRPFADFAPHQPGGPPDTFAITQGSSLAKRQLTMGDCRRARDLLELLEAQNV